MDITNYIIRIMYCGDQVSIAVLSTSLAWLVGALIPMKLQVWVKYLPLWLYRLHFPSYGPELAWAVDKQLQVISTIMLFKSAKELKETKE